MTDVRLQAAQAASPASSTSSASRAGAANGYGASSDIARQLSVTQPMQGDEFQRAVGRLTKTLDSGQPLRQDVPRGFYLNVRV